MFCNAQKAVAVYLPVHSDRGNEDLCSGHLTLRRWHFYVHAVMNNVARCETKVSPLSPGTGTLISRNLCALTPINLADVALYERIQTK